MKYDGVQIKHLQFFVTRFNLWLVKCICIVREVLTLIVVAALVKICVSGIGQYVEIFPSIPTT